MIDLTPTQHRLMEALADGLPHPKAELKACIDAAPGLVDDHTLQQHISDIRKKLSEHGFTVACVFWQRRICYCAYRPVDPLRLRAYMFGSA